MRYVLHKIYELLFEKQAMSYKLGILAVRAFSYLGYIKHEHKQLLWKRSSQKSTGKHLCSGLFVIKVACYEKHPKTVASA